MNIRIHYKDKKFNIKVVKVSFIRKIIGLMFRTRETKNLLFTFKRKNRNEIHSFFVFFPFLAIWLDDENAVVEYKLVRPFALRISPKKYFHKLIEIPLNSKNKKIIEFFVGKRNI